MSDPDPDWRHVSCQAKGLRVISQQIHRSRSITQSCVARNDEHDASQSPSFHKSVKQEADMSEVELSDQPSQLHQSYTNDASAERDASIQLDRAQGALPPADGGYQAWLCLVGCFMMNVLVWVS